MAKADSLLKIMDLGAVPLSEERRERNMIIIIDEHCQQCGAQLLACLDIAHGWVESARAWGKAEMRLPVVQYHDLYGRCVCLTCTDCGAILLWPVGSLKLHCIVDEEIEQPLWALGLSPRVRNPLEHRGLCSIKDVLKCLEEEGDEGILRIPGVGPKALAELKGRWGACGFTVQTSGDHACVKREDLSDKCR